MKKPTIDFRQNADKLFSRVFYEVRKAKTRYVVVFGGSGSSKSYSVHQSELINIMTSTEGDTLVLRKHGADLRDSVFKLFNTIIDKWGIRPYFRSQYSNDNRKITYLPTGRSIVMRGLDDSEKIKSIVGFKRIVLEEASEFNFNDFLELTRRARGMEGVQFILILNPISENHWIKKQLCEETGAYFIKTTILKYTYKDNVNGLGKSFLTAEDIEALEMLKNVDENHYLIYVLGEWGIEDKQKKFAWAFESKKHVRKNLYYDPEHILWLSFDFNVNPMTCIAAQHYDNTIKVIRAIRLENSNTWEMLEHIKSYYPDAMFKVTGDATGHNRNALSKDNLHNYQVIKNELNLMPMQLMVPLTNPGVQENQLLVNAVLLNYNVEIDEENAAPLIYDLNYVEMNSKKEIIKDRSSDKKYADFLDCFRYYLNIDMGDFLSNTFRYKSQSNEKPTN